MITVGLPAPRVFTLSSEGEVNEFGGAQTLLAAADVRSGGRTAEGGVRIEV